MINGTISSETPSAASPATDEADLAMLSRMAALAEALATGFQARGIAALKAGDLDRAGTAEAGFSDLFLGIRRAIALKARLRQQREEARRKAAAHKDRRQGEKDRRRRAVAERVSRAIAAAAGKPEAKERLTAGLWEKLTEDERIDADLADAALPIETLILRLGRDIGLSRQALAAGLDPKGKAGPDPAAADPEAWDLAVALPGYVPILKLDKKPVTGFRYTIGVWAADYGGPEGERWRHCVTSGEIFDRNGDLVMTVPIPDEPWKAGGRDTPPPWTRTAPADPGGTGSTQAVGPPDPQPPALDPEEAEFQRQAAYAKQHGITLIMPPALRERLDMRRREAAEGGSGNRSAADKRP